jgi:hypothetical protein
VAVAVGKFQVYEVLQDRPALFEGFRFWPLGDIPASGHDDLD